MMVIELLMVVHILFVSVNNRTNTIPYFSTLVSSLHLKLELNVLKLNYEFSIHKEYRRYVKVDLALCFGDSADL